MKKKLKKALKKRLHRLVVKHGAEVATALVTGFLSGMAAEREAKRAARRAPCPPPPRHDRATVLPRSLHDTLHGFNVSAPRKRWIGMGTADARGGGSMPVIVSCARCGAGNPSRVR